MKRIAIHFLFLLIPFFTKAQENIGLVTENFSGIDAVSINPSATISSPFIWDVRLAGASLFIDNSYAFLKDASTLSLLLDRNNLDVVAAHKINRENQPSANAYILDFPTQSKKSYLSINTQIKGPAAMVKIGKHKVGAFYNYRLHLGSDDLPANLSFYKFYNHPDGETLSITPFQGTFMLWDEMGLNYAYRMETQDGFLALGVNFKYLRGNEAGYFASEENLNLLKINKDTVSSPTGVLSYGITTASLDKEAFARETLGTGYGADIGFTTTFGGYQDEGYKFKFGMSLLDLGYIDFTKKAQVHQVGLNTVTEISGEHFSDINSSINGYNAFLRRFSEITTGSPTGSRQGNTFRMFLPAAVSLQADYSFNEKMFLNFIAIQNIPLGERRVVRDNILALTPRFEKRWFAAQMPILFHNYQNVRIGAAVRLAFLTIGTDNAYSLLLKNKKYSGTDLYISLRINPFNLNVGDHKVGAKLPKLSRKKIKCPF